MGNRFLLLSVAAVVLLFCLPAAIAAENLALHKSYTMKPKPTYKLCTDDADVLQLTDGKTLGSYWGNKSTVGWQNVATPVDIIIDLGRTGFIQEIRIYTTGGGLAGVEFPRQVFGFVSPDNKNFELAGIAESNQTAGLRGDSPKRIPTVLLIKNVNKTARFVKILAEPEGVYLFLDEIEVIGNLATADSTSFVKSNRFKPMNPQDIFASIEKREQFKRNLAATTETMRRKDTTFSQDFTSNILNELSSIETDISKSDMNDASLDMFRNKLGLARAKIYHAFYNKKEYVCLVADPMEIREEKTMLLVPPGTPNEISLDIWQGEYEPAAVNIINCSQKKLQLAVSLSPLSGPNNIVIDSKSTITIRRAIYVSAKGKGDIADALVLQGERPFEIRPGEITQIWMSIHNPALKAGTYRGSIGFVVDMPEANQYPIETIALNIKVEPFKLITDTKLSTNVCAYPEYIGIAKENINECARDLQEHYTNVFVVHPSSVPYLHRKPAQTSQQDEFRQFGRMIDEHSYARTFLLFLAFTPEKKDYGRFGQWMSPAWQDEFAVWLKNITNILKEHGIGYDRFALAPFDERLCAEFYEIAKLIKTIDPKIRVYANSFGKGPADFNRFQSLIDIWCMSRIESEKHLEWLEDIKGFGKEVWTYRARGPGKAHEPYSFYRLMPWWALQNGLTGVSFWVYADPHSDDSWNDYYAPAGHYGVVYIATKSPVATGGENIIPSRRWEAWREGIEDYMYFEQLQRAADKIKITNPAKAMQIQQFIKSQVDTVLKKPQDYGKINEARTQINNFLTQLAKEDSNNVSGAVF
jgi:hypothetical protein